jgi:hypothetical protein
MRGSLHPVIKLHTAGTTRMTICVSRYALKFPRGLCGCIANHGEQVEWKRATPERREMLCPLLWGAPFGFINVMRRAIPLTSEQHQAHRDNGSFPDWDYIPGGPERPFEDKPSDWGYLDGRERPVALDYPARDILSLWDGKTGSPMPRRDLTDIRPERIGASLMEGRNTAFPIIAGIIAIALAVGYAGYCFYTTAEMINKKTYDKLGMPGSSSQIGVIGFIDQLKHLRWADRPFRQMRIERARTDV